MKIYELFSVFFDILYLLNYNIIKKYYIRKQLGIVHIRIKLQVAVQN